MAGKGGGAWKVAYADFVTAMMAFFMVMWLTSQKPEVKQAVAGYFRDPFAIESGNETGGAEQIEARREAREKNQALDSFVRAMAPSGREIDSRLTLVFNDDSAVLDAVGRRELAAFVPTIIGKLNRVEIRAHCLRRPLPKESPFQDRWDLCYARSIDVRNELIKHGVEPIRLRLSQAEGNEPLSSNLAPNELLLNSRVDVILLPDYADIPWAKGSQMHASASVDEADHGGPAPTGADDALENEQQHDVDKSHDADHTHDHAADESDGHGR